MSLKNAIDFIKDAGQDPLLRNGLVKLEQAEILPELEKLGYGFTIPEFEEAINVQHVQCQTEEDANFLFHVVNWFKLLCI